MQSVKLWIVFVIFSNFLVGCLPALNSTAVPASPAENVKTVEPTRLSPASTISSSNTPFATATNTLSPPHPSPTALPLPSSTPTSSATNTPSPLASPFPSKTPTAVQETPVWSPEIEVVEIVPSEQITWSPRANEFLYETCPPDPYEQISEGSIVRVNLADDLGHIIMAKDFICSAYGISVTWAPDGQRVLFTGLSREEVDGLDYIPETADIWLIEPDSDTRIVLPQDKVSTRWAPGFYSWIDDNTVLYSGYGGGGHSSSALLNIQENTRSQLVVLHACGIRGFSDDYIIGCTAGTSATLDISALAIPLQELQQNAFDLSDETIPADDFFLNHSRYIYLSSNQDGLADSEAFTFNSYFMDWLPDTNQMLVLTWASGFDLELDAPVETDLQIWNVEEGSLNSIAQGGKYGRFSPDGRYLAYLSGGDVSFQVHLMDMTTGSVLFSQPEWAYSEYGDVFAYLSFSPDGRYFTSINPESGTDEQGVLTVYDLLDYKTIATLPGQQMKPVWSPDNTQFVYKNQYGGLTIYNLMTNSTLTITTNNDFRVSSPEWSYDGRYLSVRVDPENTAILKTP